MNLVKQCSKMTTPQKTYFVNGEEFMKIPAAARITKTHVSRSIQSGQKKVHYYHIYMNTYFCKYKQLL